MGIYRDLLKKEKEKLKLICFILNNKITMSSENNTKIIYFIRHGQARHNIYVDLYGKDFLDNNFSLTDPSLTEKGKAQCNNIKLDDDLDIIFVSPLTRTLETAKLLFKDRKLYAFEQIRERHGVRPCDQRSNINELKLKFHDINFDLCKDNLDNIWKIDHRETEGELRERIKKVILWLKNRPEKKIGIVTHCGFIVRLLKVLNLLPNENPKNCEIFRIEI